MEANDLAFAGIQFKLRYRIISKLRKARATSKESAVTAEEAGLDAQEQNWLGYFSGTFLGRIKKTEDKRYYI
jgi:hypothetical protein